MITAKMKLQFAALPYLIGFLGFIGCNNGCNNDQQFRNPYDPLSPTYEPIEPTAWHTYANLDEDSSKWGTNCIPPNSCEGSKKMVDQPSMDGRALQFSLKPLQPNGNALFSREFPSVPNSSEFRLSLFFKYGPDASNVQAIEFSMSKWLNRTRWEWAIQWENIAETGATTNPPVMRIWGGIRKWLDKGPQQPLNTSWHHLTLRGNIGKDQKVHYTNFELDGIPYSLGDDFDPVSNNKPDTIAIHIQLDGTSQQAEYYVIVDEVHLMFKY